MNIKEAAEKVGVSADTIRYYEKLGLLTRIDRTAGGIRDINERTLARINYIKNMRRAGLSIESLKTYIQLVDDGENHQKAQLELLAQQRDFLIEKRDDLNAAIDHLTFKIEHYDDHTLLAEDNLRRLERENPVKNSEVEYGNQDFIW